MPTDPRKRVVAILEKNLTREQRQLFQLVAIEAYKDKVLFRLPAGIINLETVWNRVVELMNENGILFTRANPYATIEDLDGILANISWLWPGWVPQGFNTLVAGDPGVGKSAVVLDWVSRVTRGDRWPMQQEGSNKPGNVVWIETESSQQLVNDRSKSLNAVRNRLFIPIIDGDMLGQPDIWNESHREQILNLVEAKEPKLIVLDSLGSSSSRGENRKEDVGPVMEFFAMMARDYGTATLIVHHLRKMSINEPPEVSLSRVRGSTSITALARVVVALDKPGGDKVRLSIIKNNLSKPEKPISVELRDDHKGNLIEIAYDAYVPPQAKRLKQEEAAEWVMNELAKAEGSMDLKELIDLGEANGFSRGNIYAAKRVLGDQVAVSGSGNHAIWSMANDREAEEMMTKATKKRTT